MLLIREEVEMLGGTIEVWWDMPRVRLFNYDVTTNSELSYDLDRKELGKRILSIL